MTWLHGLADVSPPIQTSAQERATLRPEVAITTAIGADLDKVLAGRTIQHWSEVTRSDRITVVVSIHTCVVDAAGKCRGSADVVLRAPDGSIHTEMRAEGQAESATGGLDDLLPPLVLPGVPNAPPTS